MNAHSLRYRRNAVMEDGTPVVVRAVRPEDKPMIADGFAHLSSESRFRRFLHHKARLTPAELRFLTELDGVDHYALGVLALTDGKERPMAIGRLVRTESLGADADTAEVAVVVMDEYQGRGIGRWLLTELVDAARERGISKLRFAMMADNQPMRRLVRSVLGESRAVERDGPVITLEANVPPQPSASCAVAPLELLPASARTRIISTR